MKCMKIWFLNIKEKVYWCCQIQRQGIYLFSYYRNIQSSDENTRKLIAFRLHSSQVAFNETEKKFQQLHQTNFSFYEIWSVHDMSKYLSEQVIRSTKKKKKWLRKWSSNFRNFLFKKKKIHVVISFLETVKSGSI